MLGQLATLIYNIVDTYFVYLTRSPAQIAAVTLCTPILLIVMSVSSIFGMGGGSLIARKMGAKEIEAAKTCVNYAIWTMAFSGAATLAVGLLLLRPIALLTGADAENVEYTCDYLRWIFLGAPFIILATGLVHILRSTGLVKEATTGVIFGNLVNVALDWLFIVRLQMGTAGAAAATSIGNLFATGYYIVCMLRRSNTQPDVRFRESLWVKRPLATRLRGRGSLSPSYSIVQKSCVSADAAAAFLRENGANIAVSLYGHCAEIHEKVTQRAGSFSQTERGLKLLKQYGVPVRIAVVIMDVNETHIPDIQRYIENIGFAYEGYDTIRQAFGGTQRSHCVCSVDVLSV